MRRVILVLWIVMIISLVKTKDLIHSKAADSIIETCYQYLQSHECVGTKWNKPYHFYRPSLQKYDPNQWLWDSSFHMITWSHRNVSNSIADLRTLLQFQQSNGFIPEIVFWKNMSKAEEIATLAVWSQIEFTDLTQMPMLAYALKAINKQDTSIALLKEFVPKLVKYMDWWAITRQPDNDGLVVIIHGWESGLDASPLYDKPYGVKHPQPKFSELYPKFVELAAVYKYRMHWNQTAIIKEARSSTGLIDQYFVVKDVGVNAVYASSWGILADLAAQFDSQLSAYCRKMQIKFETGIVTKLWNSSLKRFIATYYDPQTKSEQMIPQEAVQVLFPLLLTTIPQEYVESIVKTQVTNPNKFWTPYPFPTVSKDAPEFNPVFTIDLMWRGPVWGAPNYFILQGLLKHNYTDVAKEFVNRWIALCDKSSIWEQYNPLTGDSYGAIGLGMSTVIVDAIYSVKNL